MGGFSLAELFVAMAIVGILMAIAVVNYSNYQAKARMSEAKLSLATIYGRERSFYSQYYSYIQGMADISYTPAGDKRYYSVGWTAPSSYGTVLKYLVTPSIASYDRINYPSGWQDCALAALSSIPGANVTTATTFTVISTGQIRDDTKACDTWQIDQTKTLRHVELGL